MDLFDLDPDTFGLILDQLTTQERFCSLAGVSVRGLIAVLSAPLSTLSLEKSKKFKNIRDSISNNESMRDVTSKNDIAIKSAEDLEMAARRKLRLDLSLALSTTQGRASGKCSKEVSGAYSLSLFSRFARMRITELVLPSIISFPEIQATLPYFPHLKKLTIKGLFHNVLGGWSDCRVAHLVFGDNLCATSEEIRMCHGGFISKLLPGLQELQLVELRTETFYFDGLSLSSLTIQSLYSPVYMENVVYSDRDPYRALSQISLGSLKESLGPTLTYLDTNFALDLTGLPHLHTVKFQFRYVSDKDLIEKAELPKLTTLVIDRHARRTREFGYGRSPPKMYHYPDVNHFSSLTDLTIGASFPLSCVSLDYFSKLNLRRLRALFPKSVEILNDPKGTFYDLEELAISVVSTGNLDLSLLASSYPKLVALEIIGKINDKVAQFQGDVYFKELSKLTFDETLSAGSAKTSPATLIAFIKKAVRPDVELRVELVYTKYDSDLVTLFESYFPQFSGVKYTLKSSDFVGDSTNRASVDLRLFNIRHGRL